MKKSTLRILWGLYFVCLIPALVTLYHRHQLDKGFRSVAMVADYLQLLELSQTENTNIEVILEGVKNAGINDLAVLEDTPKFLELKGECTVIKGVGWPGWLTPKERDKLKKDSQFIPESELEPDTDWPLMLGLSHDKTHLIFSDPDIFQRIARVAENRYGDIVELMDNGGMGGVVSFAGEPKLIMEYGLGFDPVLIEKLKRAGFTLHPRLKNYPGYSAETVKSILSETSANFPSGVLIFDGDSVFRHPQEFESFSLDVGYIEFAEQKGASNLAALIPLKTVRVHSIEDEEMEVITIERAVQRYTRAVRERNVRLIYLKPFLLKTDTSSLTEKTFSMFSEVKKTVEREGFSIGTASKIGTPVKASNATLLALYLGFGLALVLTISTVTEKMTIPKTIILLIFVFLLCFGAGKMGVKIGALGLATMSATLALSWLMKRYHPVRYEVEHLRITPWLFTIAMWAGSIGIALTGALIVGAGLINEKTLLQIDSFSGVKLALYFPILWAIVAGPMIFAPKTEVNLANGVARFLSTQMKMWHVVIGLIGLVALFIMAERSGNFPLIPVADIENEIRGTMENIFAARPRTKEFLIGFPGLFIGLYIGLGWMTIRNEFMYGGLILGAIGLASMVNTFCHIHTPIELSIYRTVGGIVIGGMIGLVVSLLLLGVLGRFSRRYGNVRSMEKGSKV